MFIFNITITIGNGNGNVPKNMIHVYLIGYSTCYYMDILHNYEKLPAQKLLPKFLFRKDFDQTWKENSGKFELVFCPKTVLCRLNIGFLARQTPHMIMSSAELRLSIFGTSIILNSQTPQMIMSSAELRLCIFGTVIIVSFSTFRHPT